MNKFEEIIKQKFLNKDGSLNKTVLVSAITLIIVLVDQILAIFNVIPAHQDQVVAVLNTILTILSIFGFVEGPDTAQIINPEKVDNAGVSNVSPKVVVKTATKATTSTALSDVAMKSVATPNTEPSVESNSSK